MKIHYLVNGKKKVAEQTNEDFVIDAKNVNTRTIVKLTAKADIELIKAVNKLSFKINYSDLYFLNGYQSWTDTKEYKLSKKLRNIKNGPLLISYLYQLRKYGDTMFYHYSFRKSHGYDFFYSKGKNESFIYSLNGKVAYLIIELIKDGKYINLVSNVKGIKLKKGEEITIYDYHFYTNYQEGLEHFQKDYPMKDIMKVFGYTSWYNYYQNITEDIILRDLEGLDSRFNVFQIDDGYETFVGDWLDVDKKKFPNGLEPIVKKIHEKGYKAGLWLAPLVAETKSKVFQEHPDWIRKDKKEKPVKAGGNWSGFYCLDLENSEAVNYIQKCLSTYAEMGFDFFKLDFLYSAGLGEYDGKSNCMSQNYAYQILRDALKDKLILGCGAIIMNSYNHFDYLRIGPDVSLKFDDSPIMRILHRERISTKVTLQNTIFRSIFDQHLFANDPDVFLLRDENMFMSFEQRKALTKINALFGSVLMTSDDLATYNDEKRKILDDALNLFRNAKVDSYKTIGHKVEIHYSLNEEKHSFIYDTKKGVMENEQ